MRVHLSSRKFSEKNTFLFLICNQFGFYLRNNSKNWENKKNMLKNILKICLKYAYICYCYANMLKTCLLPFNQLKIFCFFLKFLPNLTLDMSSSNMQFNLINHKLEDSVFFRKFVDFMVGSNIPRQILKKDFDFAWKIFASGHDHTRSITDVSLIHKT